jgi:Golgi phosphoprotein 3 GPP34
MLLAEDLLLLVTDDASGRLSAPAEKVDAGLGGANLVELTLRDKVDLTGEQDPGKPGRIIVRDPSPLGDAVLDAALEVLLARQGKRPAAVIGPLSKNLRGRLYERLASRGVVRAERSRVFGVFPVRRWPADDASEEAEVRRLMAQALVQQVAPDTRTAALIALAHAVGYVDKIVDARQHGLSKRELRARAAEIAEGNWASEAVRKAIEEIMAAVMVTITAATVATTSGSGS